MKKSWIWLLVMVVGIGALIAWRLNQKHVDQQAQAKLREARLKAPISVNVAPVVVRDIINTFVGIGNVQAPFNVKIAPQVTGRVAYMQKREGDPVHVGEVLVRIDPAEILAQVSQQQANVAEAQSRLAQAELTQNPTNVGVETQIQQQQATVASNQANYNQASQNYASQVQAAKSAVIDAQGRVSAANAAIQSAGAAIRSAQANVEDAQARYTRTLDLYKQGYVASQDVDDARTQVKVQQGAVDVAQQQQNGAQASRDSALAQQQAAEQQESIVATKGKADIEAARALVAESRAALAYARSNRAQRPAYVQNLAALRSAVAAAEAQLRDARAQLAYTTLTSPLNGFVTSRYLDPGSIASPGTPVLAIQAIRSVFVAVSVPEEISRKITYGKQADITFDALPGRTFVGKVTQVNPAADPGSRQFTILVTLDNPQNLVKPGMFARVTMITQQWSNVVVVPREAIKTGPNGAYVTVVDEQSLAHTRPVQTGAQDTAGTQITSGLKPGENVVVFSAVPIKDGTKVRVGAQNQNAGAPPAVAPSNAGAAAPATGAAGAGGAGGSSGAGGAAGR